MITYIALFSALLSRLTAGSPEMSPHMFLPIERSLHIYIHLPTERSFHTCFCPHRDHSTHAFAHTEITPHMLLPTQRSLHTYIHMPIHRSLHTYICPQKGHFTHAFAHREVTPHVFAHRKVPPHGFACRGNSIHVCAHRGHCTQVALHMLLPTAAARFYPQKGHSVHVFSRRQVTPHIFLPTERSLHTWSCPQKGHQPHCGLKSPRAHAHWGSDSSTNEWPLSVCPCSLHIATQ